MTWPHKPAEDFSFEEAAANWGVERDPEEVPTSSLGRVIWIIITVLIILSLVIPWIAPLLVPNRPLVDPDILASVQTKLFLLI